jgi:hypothetical protein
MLFAYRPPEPVKPSETSTDRANYDRSVECCQKVLCMTSNKKDKLLSQIMQSLGNVRFDTRDLQANRRVKREWRANIVCRGLGRRAATNTSSPGGYHDNTWRGETELSRFSPCGHSTPIQPCTKPVGTPRRRRRRALASGSLTKSLIRERLERTFANGPLIWVPAASQTKHRSPHAGHFTLIRAATGAPRSPLEVAPLVSQETQMLFTQPDGFPSSARTASRNALLSPRNTIPR